MYNRIFETFHSRTTMRFVILLWGEKRSLLNEAGVQIPIYSYEEIINLGHESRAALLLSEDASKSFLVVILFCK